MCIAQNCRWRAWAIGALWLCGFCPAVVQAGIYNFTEPEEGTIAPDFFERYRPVLFSLRSIGMPEVQADNPLRKRYFLADALAGPNPKLAMEQQITYSAVLLRRKKYAEAIAYLTPIARQHPEVFFFDCHLALAYHRSGELQRAVDTLQPVFDRAWPADWDKLPPAMREFVIRAGWNEGLYSFYRDTEKLYLKLLRTRLSEWRRNQGKDAEFTTLDPLFGDDKGPLQYVDASGKFKPGELAPAERAKMPPTGPEMFRQLVLWLPDDGRLYWQLGELYAVNNGEAPKTSGEGTKSRKSNLLAARQIFNELVQDFNLRLPQILERRRTLNEMKSLDEDATFEDIERQMNNQPEPKKKIVTASDEQPFTWRPFGVGLVAGFATCVFFFWQVREWRRRRS